MFIDDIVKDLVTGNCDPVRAGDLSVNWSIIVFKENKWSAVLFFALNPI
jgi:hypothetical protein